MDTIKFLSELSRMCEVETCDKCPLCSNETYCLASPGYKLYNPRELYEKVNIWSKEHPQVTNFTKLNELFPGKFYMDGSTLCTDLLDEDFWNNPYKENENEIQC